MRRGHLLAMLARVADGTGFRRDSVVVA